MAYVAKVEAHGVLSFTALDLDLSRALTTVAGPNSIGKSNIALCLKLVRGVVGRYAGAEVPGRLAEFETWGFEGAGAFHVALGLELDQVWERELVANYVRATIAYGGGDQAAVGTMAKALKPELVELLMNLRLDPVSLLPLYSGVLHVFFDATLANVWTGAWEFTHGAQQWHIVLFGTNQGQIRPGPAASNAPYTATHIPGLAEVLLGPFTELFPAAKASDDSFGEKSPREVAVEDALDELPSYAFGSTLSDPTQAIGFHLSTSHGSSAEKVLSLRRLAAGLGIQDPSRHDIGFTLVLWEVLRHTIVLTDNRRVLFNRDFDISELSEPIEIHDGANTAALLHVLKLGDAAQRARFTDVQRIFTLLTGARFDVQSRPTYTDATTTPTLTIEPVILSPQGDRPMARSGTGRQEALVLATLLTGPPGRLLVLDEPAANLEGVGQRRLIGVLRNAGQCLLITHSADLVPIHHDGDIYNLVRLGPSGEGAVAHRVGTLTPQQESKLVKAFTAADMRALLFADMVVLLEGETEAAVLQRWWSDLHEPELPPWETVNIYMVSVGGQAGFGTYVDCLQRFGVPWAIIADGPALARTSKLADQFIKLGIMPADLPQDEGFAVWREMWRGLGVFTLAEEFGIDGGKGGEIEAFLTRLNPDLYTEAQRELGRSKPRLAAYFAAQQDPPREVIDLYRDLTGHFGLRRDHPLPASALPGGFNHTAKMSVLAVPRLPVDPDSLTTQAGKALEEFPHLARKLSLQQIQRSAVATRACMRFGSLLGRVCCPA